MRRISMTTRDELVAAIAARYAQGDRIERGRILDEFAAVTGFHRKHAMRLLRAGQPNRRSGPRPGRRVYDDAVREALIVVWEASDRVCGTRQVRRAAGRLLPPRSGVACRCAPLTAGTIRRPGSSRRIWWRIADQWRRAASCKP